VDDRAAATPWLGCSCAGHIQNFPDTLQAIADAHPEAERVEVWFLDESRVGQKGRLTRRWYAKGHRPRGIRDHRFRSAWIFGAVCPERDTGGALVTSHISTEAMACFLAELAKAIPKGTHAAVIMDQAGWHVAGRLDIPATITLVPLPPYSPELNPIERLWRSLKDNKLSNRVFSDLAAVIDACCEAWNTIIAETGRIRSICSETGVCVRN
jgi:transposase